MANMARMVGGFALLIVGVLGIVLPILPGWIFLIPGLALLAREFHWARRTLDWLKKFRPQKFSAL